MRRSDIQTAARGAARLQRVSKANYFEALELDAPMDVVHAVTTQLSLSRERDPGLGAIIPVG